MAIGLLPKPSMNGLPPFPKDSDERPTKVQKTGGPPPNSKKKTKAAKRLEKHQNAPKKVQYTVKGRTSWRPYRQFGYDEHGQKNPGPNSSRTQRKNEVGAKKEKGGGKEREKERKVRKATVNQQSKRPR